MHQKKKNLYLYLQIHSRTVFSSCLIPANQRSGFSMRGTSTPNGFIPKSGLKLLMGYTKGLHQLKHGALFHLKIKNLELSVNY